MLETDVNVLVVIWMGTVTPATDAAWVSAIGGSQLYRGVVSAGVSFS